MTVKELIEQLQAMPDASLEARILTDIGDVAIESVDCEEGDGGWMVLVVAVVEGP